jgi:hypothetical protein
VTVAILSILGALVPLLVWWVRRRAARQDAPEAKRDQIHGALAKGNENDVNRLLDDAVRGTPPTTDRVRDD